MDVSELLRDRQASLFGFMNQDQGHDLFWLDGATTILGSVLQCFTSQDYLHAAATDKFKRRVTWHRALPFDFVDAVDRNSLFLISGLFFAQKLAAAADVVQCIDFCRKRLWCPSSAACCQQQQRESCFMSSLLLHAMCVAHPLFTFCGAVADAVQRLLGWLQRPILLTVNPANPKQIVTVQPQSLDTWPSPAIPLEAHTLVHQFLNIITITITNLIIVQERVLACLALMSQCKQGMDVLRSDDSMLCVARVWDVLSACCGCIVRGEGGVGTASISQHLVSLKGTAVLVACMANILGTLANIALEQVQQPTVDVQFNRNISPQQPRTFQQ